MPLYRVNNIELKYVVDDMVTNEQREKGTRLHNVFKRIKYIDDVDVALHYCKVKGIIPIEEFDGVVIAIIHRHDDIEEKWVVAPVGMTFTKEEIAAQTAFQEQYFKTEIRMEILK